MQIKSKIKKSKIKITFALDPSVLFNDQKLKPLKSKYRQKKYAHDHG